MLHDRFACGLSFVVGAMIVGRGRFLPLCMPVFVSTNSTLNGTIGKASVCCFVSGRTGRTEEGDEKMPLSFHFRWSLIFRDL